MQTDIIGVTIGVLGIFIGLVASYYFYIKSIRTKKPQWTMSINTLIQDYSGSFDKLKVVYDRKRVENLSVSKILFWNQGSETIHFDDIRTANPLRIRAGEDVKFLDVKVLRENNVSSLFELSLSDDRKFALIQFDYLDQGHGALFQVVHTGTKLSDVLVVGDIKGAKDIEFKIYKGEKFVDRIGDSVFLLMAMLYLPLLLYGSISDLFFSHPTRIAPWLNWIFLIVGVIGLIYFPKYFISRNKSIAKYPKEFKNML